MNTPNNWNQFVQVLLQSPALQETLKKANDIDSFLKLAVQLGKEKGYNFTQSQLQSLISQAQAPMFEDLNDDQLELVSGGKVSNKALYPTCANACPTYSLV